MLSYLLWWVEVEEVGEDEDSGDFQGVGQARVLMSQITQARPKKRTKSTVQVGETQGEASRVGDGGG